LRKSSFFPDVLLSMADNAEKTCPFLTDAGCSVYTDRPDACRSFPLEVGIMYDNNSQEKRAVHFFRPPEFCLGQNEKTTWTAKTWTKDQEAVMYNKMTTLWSQLKSRFQTNPWGKEGPQGRKGKMAFMATYNIDKFRSFILNSTFLKRYGLNRSLLKKVKTDDRELMLIGFEWVKLFIWGEQSSFIKPVG